MPKNQPQVMIMVNSREAAFLALLASLRLESFISDYLEGWQKKESPTPRDFSLAYEIASGSARLALALDYIAEKLSSKKKLSLKLKERALLRTAIYQRYFLNKIPLYAIVDETVKIAKKHCHPIFCNFLNALLRKMEQEAPSLPTEKTPHALSLRYSYPPYFVAQLLENFGLAKTEEILEVGNIPPLMMARKRGSFSMEIFKGDEIQKFVPSSDYYIQNRTPVELVNFLAEGSSHSPKRILDLCASPGGKTLMAYDLFPHAQFFANDVSEEKLKKLRENFAKYHLEVTLSCGLGEEYASRELFDLIILDVPCSNSGVLSKRPEARWRLNLETLKELKTIQLKLLKRAKDLLAPKGKIWFLTCSILPDENEKLVQEACQNYLLGVKKQQLLLPTKEGSDGGFACLLSLTS